MRNQSSTTRRDFLKTTAAAGAAMAANLTMLSNVHAAGEDAIKVGIIGCGGRGSGAAENVLHAAKNVEIVALGDVFKFRVDGLQKRLQSFIKQDAKAQDLGNRVDVPEDRCFAGLDCHDRVLNSGANYIILASPPGFRPLHLEAAIAAGKNIFTEKPVCVDGPGARKVYAAYEDAVKKNLRIAAGTQRRHEHGYLETMQRVLGGEIGDIAAMRCYWNGNGIWFRKRDELKKHNIPDSDLAFQLHNWYHFVWTCGDHIVEQHVHNLDVCNWAMGNKHPVRAVGMGSRLSRPAGEPREAGNIFDNFAIDFEYEGGVHMLSMCRHIPGTHSDVSEALVGTKGTCRPDQFSINGKRIVKERGADPYVQEHTDLIECIRSGKPLNELKTVADSSMTAVMGRMAGYTGKLVKWDQVLNSQLDTMPAKLSWDMSLSVPDVAMPGKTPLV